MDATWPLNWSRVEVFPIFEGLPWFSLSVNHVQLKMSSLSVKWHYCPGLLVLECCNGYMVLKCQESKEYSLGIPWKSARTRYLSLIIRYVTTSFVSHSISWSPDSVVFASTVIQIAGPHASYHFIIDLAKYVKNRCKQGVMHNVQWVIRFVPRINKLVATTLFPYF